MDKLMKAVVATATFDIIVPDDWTDNVIEQWVKDQVELTDPRDSFMVIQIEEINDHNSLGR